MPSRGAAILSQIEGLLEQYLAEGEDTPFYQQAQTMLTELQSTLGRGGSVPAEPAEGELLMGPEMEEAMTPPSNFADARKGATAKLTELNQKSSEDEELRKKKAKAR